MLEEITLRAHHGMCLAFFQGKGYSDTFAAHMGRVKDSLEDCPERLVRITAAPDEICSACPCLENGACSAKEKTDRYDSGVLKACGIENDSVMSWRQFSDLVEERIFSPGRRREICPDCQWDSICVFPDQA